MAKRYTKKRIKKQMKKRKTGKLRYKKKRRGTSRRRYTTRKKKGGTSTPPLPPPRSSAAVVLPPSPPPAARDCNTVDREFLQLTKMLNSLKVEKEKCINNVYDLMPGDSYLPPPFAAAAPPLSAPVSSLKERQKRRNIVGKHVKVRSARTGTRRVPAAATHRNTPPLTASPPSRNDGREDNTEITHKFNDRWGEFFLPNTP